MEREGDVCMCTLVSTLYLERSRDSVALRSPCVRAPRLSNLLATMLANLCSPASSDMRNTYSGAFTWLERWVRPAGEVVYVTSCTYSIYMYTCTLYMHDSTCVYMGSAGLPNCWIALSAVQGNSSVM